MLVQLVYYQRLMRACQVADVRFDNVSTSLCFGTNTHYPYWHNMSDTYSISAIIEHSPTWVYLYIYTCVCRCIHVPSLLLDMGGGEWSGPEMVVDRFGRRWC